jgi:Flp pilus assembly protein TadG
MPDTNKKGSTTQQEDGQALLEFALVSVFLVLVLFGIIDFARIFFGYATMSNAAREGARYGIVHPGDPSYPTDDNNQAIIEAARQRMVVIGGTEPVVYVAYPLGGATRLCPIRVRVSSTMEVWTPILPSVTLVATATMHIE